MVDDAGKTYSAILVWDTKILIFCPCVSFLLIHASELHHLHAILLIIRVFKGNYQIGAREVQLTSTTITSLRILFL